MFNVNDMYTTKMPKGKKVEYKFDDYILSVVKNSVSYGNQEGLYEISIFKNDTQIELPGITDPGDTVKGWLTEDDVNSIIIKMITITGTDAKIHEAQYE